MNHQQASVIEIREALRLLAQDLSLLAGGPALSGTLLGHASWRLSNLTTLCNNGIGLHNLRLCRTNQLIKVHAQCGALNTLQRKASACMCHVGAYAGVSARRRNTTQHDSKDQQTRANKLVFRPWGAQC